jgi:hypothetical protein
MCKHCNSPGRNLAQSPAPTDRPCAIKTDTADQRRTDTTNIYIGVAKLLNFRPKSVYDKRGITSHIISKYFLQELFFWGGGFGISVVNERATIFLATRFRFKT